MLFPKTESDFCLLKDSASPDSGKTYFESLPSRAFRTLQRRFDLLRLLEVAPAFDYRSTANCQRGGIDLPDRAPLQASTSVEERGPWRLRPDGHCSGSGSVFP